MRFSLGLLVLALATLVHPLRAAELVLEHATVVDPATGESQTATLYLKDGTISGKDVPQELSGERLDLEGKWIVPGLRDLHVHSYGNGGPGGKTEFLGTATVAKRALYAGVTGFLDLFGFEPQLLAVRGQQRAGGLPGAEILASLSCLTATEGHCTEYGVPTRTMDTPEEAREQVSSLARNAPDVIKIVYHHTPGAMPSVDRATLEAAVAEAKKHGLKTVIHVGSWQDVEDAVEVGASAVTHIPTSDVVSSDLAKRMADRGIVSIPTLSVQCDLPRLVGDENRLADPLLTAITGDALRNAYAALGPQDPHVGHRLQRAKTCADVVLPSVRRLAAEGVAIVAGTDAGNLGTFHGYSLHRELLLLVEAGLTPSQALAAATTTAGEFLGRAWGVGPGDEATLLVLDASPLESIGNTQRIHAVIQNGVVVDREALLARPSEQ